MIIEGRLLLILIILSILLGGIFILSDTYMPVSSASDKVFSFTVEKGQGAKEISINLKNAGIIKHTSTFRIHALLTGRAQKLQAGQYELSLSMSVSQMVEKMAKGDIIKSIITIIEGWNLKNISEYFVRQGICTEEEFYVLANKDFANGLTILKDKPKSISIEGYLFPDTYEIIPGTSAEAIFKKILSHFEGKLNSELREEIVGQKKTIFSIITAASLIEKEVRTLEDKKIVSGILWKRMQIGMPLQIDATITYLTGRKSTAVSLNDLQIDSPYNTYKYYGLPIGPISSPGLESIIAAIYPTKTDYLYYFTALDGRTIFSKTYSEHQKQLGQYR